MSKSRIRKLRQENSRLKAIIKEMELSLGIQESTCTVYIDDESAYDDNYYETMSKAYEEYFECPLKVV